MALVVKVVLVHVNILVRSGRCPEYDRQGRQSPGLFWWKVECSGFSCIQLDIRRERKRKQEKWQHKCTNQSLSIRMPNLRQIQQKSGQNWPLKCFYSIKYESVLFSIHTVTEADIGNGDAADFRVTEAQQKRAAGLVLQNDVKMLLPNKAKDESAVDNSTDYWKIIMLY